MAKAKRRWCVWATWKRDSESCLVCTFESISALWSAYEMALNYKEIIELDGRLELDTSLVILPEGRRPK